ncbi:MAG: ABC transporter ATP-binding protein [Candidatus Heimdallarchaeota archaeon]|nr:ABC transporter ATP-binding protein [Candidatus Heimdallarchaeota archaeon]
MMSSIGKPSIQSSANSIILKVKNLSFRYSKKSPVVLKNISFNVEQNNLTVIAGPNGSGKTTLIKHLNGLILPQSGEVVIKEFSVSQRTKKTIQKIIGVVFQNPDEQIFYPRVSEDVAFGPRNMKLTKEQIKERVDKALEEVQITELKDRITFNLSFGEKKKVAFAGILAMSPEIIILDEPTIGIDPWSKPRMIKLIRSFKENRTVIVITHDFEMMKSADRILYLDNGILKGDFNSFDEFYSNAFSKN